MSDVLTESATYRIRHQTLYRYSEPVAICQNQLRMLPRSRSCKLASVQCHRVDTNIRPTPNLAHQHEDYFGNDVYTFSIETVHQQLDITIDSEVTVQHEPWPAGNAAPSWNDLVDQVRRGTDERWLEVGEYCFDSPRITRHQQFADYAKASFDKDHAIDLAVLDLTNRIHADFEYDTTATEVETPTNKAFELRAGVCQDFAQVQIACLRSIGLPAKYVSGYLRTVPREGEPRLVGADESHAWVSVYMGSALGWVDVDPTNACRCDTSHIPLCVGRDYSEVSPMRGVVLGGGRTQLSVNVDVELVGEQ